MAKYVINANGGALPRGAYSQGWRAGDFIFVTGSGPIDPKTNELIGDDIESQTDQTIDNLQAVLAADGASLGDVVKVTVHLSDVALFPRYNEAYARRFSKPCPVRTTVGSQFPMAGMLIEMDCIAYMPSRKSQKGKLVRRDSRSK